MKSLHLIPAITALVLLYSSPCYGQTSVRETPAPTEMKGTVAVWRPDSGIILADKATAPVEFILAKKVLYIDNSGKPVAREIIQPGDPVTIRYLREGDRLLVSQVTMERKPTPTPTASTNSETVTKAESSTAPKARESYVLKDLEIIRARMEKEARHSNEHHR